MQGHFLTVEIPASLADDITKNVVDKIVLKNVDEVLTLRMTLGCFRHVENDLGAGQYLNSVVEFDIYGAPDGPWF